MNSMIYGRETNEFPSAPFPEGICYQCIARTDPVYPFLHDTALGLWQDRILCAWYNCTEGEILGHTVIRGRWSADHGKTWSDPEVIAESSDPEIHYVPVSFAGDGRNFYAFVTRMSGHDLPTGYEVFRYTGTGWESVSVREDRFLFNTPPIRMDDGHFLAAGRVATPDHPKPEIPAVAVSTGTDVISGYRIIPLPGPWTDGHFPLRFPETAVIIDGRDMTAFTRGETFTAGEKHPPLRYTSHDFGRTWSEGESTDLPEAQSKLFAGTLSNGLRYLIFNAENDRMAWANGRKLLVLGVCARGGDRIERCYRLLDGHLEQTGQEPEWSYPCALEFDGRLWISCTSAKTGAVLMSVPIGSLEG